MPRGLWAAEAWAIPANAAGLGARGADRSGLGRPTQQLMRVKWECAGRAPSTARHTVGAHWMLAPVLFLRLLGERSKAL